MKSAGLAAAATIPSSLVAGPTAPLISTEDYERWEAIGFLEGLDPKSRVACAAMLENQRLYNQTLGRDSDEEQTFRLISIPIIRRLFSILPPGKLEAWSFSGDVRYINPTIEWKVADIDRDLRSTTRLDASMEFAKARIDELVKALTKYEGTIRASHLILVGHGKSSVGLLADASSPFAETPKAPS